MRQRRNDSSDVELHLTSCFHERHHLSLRAIRLPSTAFGLHPTRKLIGRLIAICANWRSGSGQGCHTMQCPHSCAGEGLGGTTEPRNFAQLKCIKASHLSQRGDKACGRLQSQRGRSASLNAWLCCRFRHGIRCCNQLETRSSEGTAFLSPVICLH